MAEEVDFLWQIPQNSACIIPSNQFYLQCVAEVRRGFAVMLQAMRGKDSVTMLTCMVFILLILSSPSCLCQNLYDALWLVAPSHQFWFHICIYLSICLKKINKFVRVNLRGSHYSNLSVNSVAWLSLAPLFRKCALKETNLEINPWWCHTGHWNLSQVNESNPPRGETMLKVKENIRFSRKLKHLSAFHRRL